MKILKGMRFGCIKDVEMYVNGIKGIKGVMSGQIAYRAGKTYTSEKDDCITNDWGNFEHAWECGEIFETYFQPLWSNDLVNAVVSQQQQLNAWKVKLNTAAFKALYDYCEQQNSIAIEANHIVRGVHLVDFIQNWKP